MYQKTSGLEINENLKNILTKIGYGICYGIGICIVLGTVLYVFDTLNHGSEINTYPSIQKEEKTKFSIKDQKLVVPNENRIEIIGRIENSGTYSWYGIEIEIELYDDSDNFIYECHDYIKGPIESMKHENFMVGCDVAGFSLPKNVKFKTKISDSVIRKDL